MTLKKSILPLIVGIGGINSAGRSSGFHSYKRMVYDVLSDEQMKSTWLDLANRMGIKQSLPLTYEELDLILSGTLIRKIDSFDTENVLYHHKATLEVSPQSLNFILKKNKIPKNIPPSWTISELNSQDVSVTINGKLDVLIPDFIRLPVSSAGNIPSGFDPGKLYRSHQHPRGLKLAVYGISDLLNSLGIAWEEILNYIKPDEVSVYAGSAFGQVDEYSLSGLISQSLKGSRVNSKMLTLSLAEMSADFINSYVINSVGSTGTNMGACASFLYNLRQGIADLQLGRAKVVIVGNADACVTPELIEGFRAMGALATDEDLCALDKSTKPNLRRACRPFSTNSGFTIAEASQFIMLMDESLALELGANIYGAVADVFINADGNKDSISKPGIGNYITFGKATALAQAILGNRDMNKTFVQAHGPGTPLNRITESHILNETAKAFGIKNWPITAIKSYVGHSVSASAGDQLLASLGVWNFGWIPGIKTIDHIADDVECSNLNILMDHLLVKKNGENMYASLINSKGFGGNNATGLILSPMLVKKMLHNKYNLSVIRQYDNKNKKVRDNIEKYDNLAAQGNEKIIYKFGANVMNESSINIKAPNKLSLSEYQHDIELPTENPYSTYFE